MMYFDSAATTNIDSRVVEAMTQSMNIFGNASSKHYEGYKALDSVNNSLKTVANFLGVKESQVFACHGGTEGNRRLIQAFEKRFGKENIWCSGVEHSSVLDEIDELQRFDPYSFEGLPEDPKVIFCMGTNNETGVVFDIPKLRKKFPNSIIVMDFVQGCGKVSFDFSVIDAAVISAHKFYGPKGVGAIYLKDPEHYREIAKDGHTKNIQGLVGMAKALEIYKKDERMPLWKNQIETILKGINGSIIHDLDYIRVDEVISVSFKGLRGSELMTTLSEKERICVSTGSACSSDILAPSHVMVWKKIDPEHQYPIRISLHKDLEQSDVDHLCEVLPHYVEELRNRNML